MARKRFSDEDILNLLRQIELELASGGDVTSACRNAGIDCQSWVSPMNAEGARLEEPS